MIWKLTINTHVALTLQKKTKNKLADDCYKNSLEGRHCLNTCRQIVIFVPNQMGFPCGSAGKSACNAGDLGLIPRLGRSPGEENGYPLQYAGLEKSTYCIIHGVAKSRTWLSNFHFIPNQACCEKPLHVIFSQLPALAEAGHKTLRPHRRTQHSHHRDPPPSYYLG